MHRYGLYPSAVAEVFARGDGRLSVDSVIRLLLEDPSGRPDGLALALVATESINPFVLEVSQSLDCPTEEVSRALRSHLDAAVASDFPLTGAEAVTLILRDAGVATVFAYAGTSELALCDSVARAPDIELINGRGDKECAFMAAGASLLTPNRGVAILHGARGLTNATGAVADSRRNEVATVFIVGLPSTSSACFLPPHGEAGLMKSIGNFVKWWYEVGPVSVDGAKRARAAACFVEALRTAISQARSRPYGPTMFGLPQDVAESAWIPWSALAMEGPAHCDPSVAPEQIRSAVDLVTRHQRVLILIDDYLLKYDCAKQTLAEFAALCGAPVLQVKYRRGAMLFERLTNQDVPAFIGWLDPMSAYHRKLLSATDLLITLEDRNMYRRVIGDLPTCQKIAINSDTAKVLKNEYLTESDMLIEADVVAVLRALNEELSRRRRGDGMPSIWADAIAAGPAGPAIEVTPEAQMLRSGIVGALASVMRNLDAPVLVDDSQMFGGMICELYDQLPSNVRIFGDHGGFVGGGIAYATGLAIANPSVQVFCSVGDQGFTNAFQGLVAAVQEKARVVYLICNNGESVSLLKQSLASQPRSFDGGRQPYLHNPKHLDYARVASALGVASRVVEFPMDQGAPAIKRAGSTFRERLLEALSVEGPSLIELRFPPRGEAWAGIWLTQGYEQFAGVHE